ncbi:hypothetical protein ACIBSV_09005 [Embleya sp. NPDC050154]|uniref:hypothetical protein n=1 Tax=Embleya sp. NPDC050154 TaxID=3363988 RepID=UPI0037A69D21
MSRRNTARTRAPRRLATLGALAALTTIAGLAAAPAAQAGPMPGADKHKPAICKRLPAIDTRLDKAIERLNGAAAVKGSIAHLQERIATADRLDRPAVKTYLNDRLTTRQRLLPELRQRKTDLANVKTWCDARQPAAGK